jgi:hypothetical protein
VDKDGNEVYDATPTVSFTASGAGKIYSTGSDISEHSSLFLSTRKMRAGRIGVAVKMTEREGKLTVIAQAEGLLPAIFEQEISK